MCAAPLSLNASATSVGMPHRSPVISAFMIPLLAGLSNGMRSMADDMAFPNAEAFSCHHPASSVPLMESMWPLLPVIMPTDTNVTAIVTVRIAGFHVCVLDQSSSKAAVSEINVDVTGIR